MKRVIDKDTDNINIHVLIAEDDSFQRLMLIDILSLCDYEVTAVENGRIARDELLKENNQFDLVLLDVMMPEIDGLELLCLMQRVEKLKNIPVIMMSSDGQQERVATCLAKGARDYLVKPIRIQIVKGISRFVDKNKNPIKPNTENIQYKKLSALQQGASGSVDLVQRTDNGELYALKVIPLHYMSEEEKVRAELEVTLLKVLVAPTIIRYYDSFIEDNSLCIVMEFAKYGSLFDKITEKKNKGEKFSNEQIMYYITQLIISIMFMHSKNILHRDIKTQNIFLTSDNIIKLGDFGIAKDLGSNEDMTKSIVGTPYFMSPEVCSGQLYGEKADMWGIGCALYEMAMRKRPFQHDNINVLFDMIQNSDPEPVNDDEVCQDIIMLINSLLDKDPNKRPSAWELVKMPCIFKCIEKYFKEESPNDFFLENIIQDIKENGEINKLTKINKPKASITIQDSSNNNNNESLQKPSQNAERVVEGYDKRIIKIFKGLRLEVQPERVQSGFMKYEDNLVQGKVIQRWFKEHYPGSDEMVRHIIDEMMERKYIHLIQNHQKLSQRFYRFQQDIPGIPMNMVYILDNHQEIDPLKVQQNLIQVANSVLKELKDNSEPINAQKLLKNKKFSQFEELVCELQLTNLYDLENKSILPFFANLLQIIYFHYYVRDLIKKEIGETHPSSEKTGIIRKIFSFASLFAFPKKRQSDIEVFQYQIQDMKFSLDDIKHGILRGNKKSQFESSFYPFSKSDKRYQFIQHLDERVLMLFREEDSVPNSLVYLDEENYDQELDKYCVQMLNSHVSFDRIENELLIHKIFKFYGKDFNQSEKSVLDFIFRYVKNNTEKDLIKEGVKIFSISLQYEEQFL